MVVWSVYKKATSTKSSTSIFNIYFLAKTVLKTKIFHANHEIDVLKIDEVKVEFAKNMTSSISWIDEVKVEFAKNTTSSIFFYAYLTWPNLTN
jgi:hypothetical protein